MLSAHAVHTERSNSQIHTRNKRRIKTISYSHHFWFHVFRLLLQSQAPAPHVCHIPCVASNAWETIRQGAHAIDNRKRSFVCQASHLKHTHMHALVRHKTTNKRHRCHNLLLQTLRDIILSTFRFQTCLGFRFVEQQSTATHTQTKAWRDLWLARYVFYSLSLILPASLVNVHSSSVVTRCDVGAHTHTWHRTQFFLRLFCFRISFLFGYLLTCLSWLAS